MGGAKQKTNSPTAFFTLTFILSAPLYLLNMLAFLQLLGTPSLGPLYIALLTFTPAVAAALLTWRAHGSSALKILLLRVFDYQRIGNKWWYLPTVLLGPLIFAMSVGWMVYWDVPVGSAMVPFLALPGVFALFFLLAAVEEMGWMGYAFAPLKKSKGALPAALVLGVIWSIWHAPFFFFMFPDWTMFGAELLTLVAARILLVWVFMNSGRSVFAAVLYHAADNTAFMIFPDIKGVVSIGPVVHFGFAFALAFVVILLWDWNSMTRLRFGTLSKGPR